jgi:hypothetical protein
MITFRQSSVNEKDEENDEDVGRLFFFFKDATAAVVILADGCSGDILPAVRNPQAAARSSKV